MPGRCSIGPAWAGDASGSTGDCIPQGGRYKRPFYGAGDRPPLLLVADGGIAVVVGARGRPGFDRSASPARPIGSGEAKDLVIRCDSKGVFQCDSGRDPGRLLLEDGPHDRPAAVDKC